MNGLGARLRTARKAKGLRQEDVAKALYLHRSAYTKYEIDAAEPSLDDLCTLARLLEVPVERLLDQCVTQQLD